MPGHYVSDMRHGLDESGRVFTKVATVRDTFRSLSDYVCAALLLPAGKSTGTVFRCIARRGRGRCKGRVHVSHPPALGPPAPPEVVEWSCDACGSAGEIRGWEGTPFDLPPGFEPERPGEEIHAIVMEPENVDAMAARCDLRSPFRLLLLRSMQHMDQVALRFTAEQYAALEVDLSSGRLQVDTMPSKRAPDDASQVESKPQSRSPAKKQERPVIREAGKPSPPDAAAAFVTGLFERSPSSPAELRSRIARVDGGAVREVLLRRVMQGDVPIGAEDLWVAAFVELCGTEGGKDLAAVVEGAGYAPRGRALAFSALQMIDRRAASLVMQRLPQRDSARILAEQLRSIVRSIEDEPEIAETLGRAISSIAGSKPLHLLESIESIRVEEGVPASFVYRAVLAHCVNAEVATFAATRMVEEGDRGRLTVQSMLPTLRAREVRSAVEDVLAENRATPQTNRVRGDAWISGCDGVGAVIVFFMLERPIGGHCLVNVAFRVTGEVRDSFFVPKMRSDELETMMRTMTEGGVPPFLKVSLGIAVRLLRDAIERGEAEGRKLPRESEPAIARLDLVADERIPDLPLSIGVPSIEAVERLLSRPDYQAWFFSPGDLREAGIQGDRSRQDAAMVAIARSSLPARLIAMSEYMARWCTLGGDSSPAATHAANARLLRADFERTALPRVMFQRSRFRRNDELEVSAPKFGDEAVRHAIRRQFFREIETPVGRDLARLDFAEVARSLLGDYLPRLPAAEHPRDDQMLPIAVKIGAAFENGASRVEKELRKTVARILRDGSKLSDEHASEVASVVTDGLDSFRTVVCGSCRIRCIDAPDAPVKDAFFSTRHPAMLGGRS